MAFVSLEQIMKCKSTVVGLGVSGLAVIDFLLSKGAHVTARDAKEIDQLGEAAHVLQEKGVPLFTGDDYLKDITEEVIFRAPGVHPETPALQRAVASGASMTSEMELFLSLCRAQVLGITGSDGKTTTTTLTGLFLEAECRKTGKGRVFVGGNIGEPLLPRVEEMTPDDYAVVELSSFQLQTFDRSVARAVMTNVTENHLNWHADMAEYTRAKSNIYRHPGNRLLVVSADNPITESLARQCTGQVTLVTCCHEDPRGLICRESDSILFLQEGMICRWDGQHIERILPTSKILVPGKHNLENFMSAIALTWGLVSKESILEVAERFRGVRHRLEPIGEINGISYYNSSIDTTPARTKVSLEALSHLRPIVICGGSHKNTPFPPLAEALVAHAGGVVLTGAAAPLIKAALLDRPEVQSGAFLVWEAGDFRDAVALACDKAKEGSAVLLSPACASFDAFRSYQERGDLFCSIVNDFRQKKG